MAEAVALPTVVMTVRASISRQTAAANTGTARRPAGCLAVAQTAVFHGSQEVEQSATLPKREKENGSRRASSLMCWMLSRTRMAGGADKFADTNCPLAGIGFMRRSFPGKLSTYGVEHIQNQAPKYSGANFHLEMQPNGFS